MQDKTQRSRIGEASDPASLLYKVGRMKVKTCLPQQALIECDYTRAGAAPPR
ncbi:MAG: hypothetical protein WC913_02735 [Desulfuromonas sp.]